MQFQTPFFTDQDITTAIDHPEPQESISFSQVKLFDIEILRFSTKNPETRKIGARRESPLSMCLIDRSRFE